MLTLLKKSPTGSFKFKNKTLLVIPVKYGTSILVLHTLKTTVPRTQY